MPKKINFIIFISYLIVSILSYLLIIPNYFISDDFVHIGKIIKQGLFFYKTGFIRPLIYTTYLFDYIVWGLNPIGFHLTNILLHSFASFGVYLVGYHLFENLKSKTARISAFTAGLFFLVLSCHSESVSWISGRTDIIATIFSLFSTWCYILLFNKKDVKLFVLFILFFIASLLSKESAIIMPFVWTTILVYSIFLKVNQSIRQSSLLLIFSYFILGFYFIIRKIILGQFIGGYSNTGHFVFLKLDTFYNLSILLYKTFLPPLPANFISTQFNDTIVFICSISAFLCIILFFCIVFYRLSQRDRLPIIVLFISYLICLLPTVTMSIDPFTSRSERFLYLPSVFACLLIIYLIFTLIQKFRTRIFIIVLFIIFQLIYLERSNLYWKAASKISKQIAQEVSMTDPEKTIVLNLPDNYRGAWVMRNGLNYAATVFQKNEIFTNYKFILTHDLNNLQEEFSILQTDTSIIILIPKDVLIRNIKNIDLKRSSRPEYLKSFVIPFEMLPYESVLLFQSGDSNPMFKKIIINDKQN